MSRLILGILLLSSIIIYIGITAMKKEKTTSTQKATFAGGCFWCMQEPFDTLSGVISTTVGYIGGTIENPTYEQVCSGKTGHVEAIQIVFDPKKISYKKLLAAYWKNIDPTMKQGQFCDIGTQYQPIIFYHNDLQRREAEESKSQLQIYPVVVEIREAGPFYPAETYHQKFYQKNTKQYKRYHDASGRPERLNELWNSNSSSF